MQTELCNAIDEAAPPAADWVRVCALEDIPPLGARVARLARAEVAVFRTADDEVFALLDRCPHKGGPLSQGIVHGRLVSCPLHGWNIALDSGEAVAPDRGCAPRIAVKVERGEVYLAGSFSDANPAAACPGSGHG